jgi:hypothetical protein
VPVSEPAPDAEAPAAEPDADEAAAAPAASDEPAAPAGSKFGSVGTFWSSVLQADDPPKARRRLRRAHARVALRRGDTRRSISDDGCDARRQQVVVTKADYKFLGAIGAPVDNYFRVTGAPRRRRQRAHARAAAAFHPGAFAPRPAATTPCGPIGGAPRACAAHAAAKWHALPAPTRAGRGVACASRWSALTRAMGTALRRLAHACERPASAVCPPSLTSAAAPASVSRRRARQHAVDGVQRRHDHLLLHVRALTAACVVTSVSARGPLATTASSFLR